jgi:hypothetical protein
MRKNEMKKSKKPKEYFEGIKAGLDEAIAWTNGKNVSVTIREVELPEQHKHNKRRSKPRD